ncbi:MAG TPA: hypothetical protein VF498_16905 [Anaerolineales bacterium]
MAAQKVKINRAPVLTLWAAVVAERLGFDSQEALTLGKAVAGLNAQSKGQRLGIFEPDAEKVEKARERQPGEDFFIRLLGRSVPALNTDGGVRAVVKGRPANPSSVQRYLERKFTGHLPDVRAAMEALAASYSPSELAPKAYALYEKFRPEIPEGVRGWGAEGELDLDAIREMAK